MKLTIRTALLIMTLWLSACSVNTSCDDYHVYRSTQVQPPIAVPADLDQPVNESIAPDTGSADATKVDRNAAGECLEKPPQL